MLRILFLILIVMSSVAFAQTDENPQAVKIDEFERATNGEVKARMDYFYTELNNNPSAQGYIINYGTAKEIAIRERQIRNAIMFRKFDSSRITIVNGGFRGIIKTEFWAVPAGADNPNVESSSKKVDEFGIIPDGYLKASIDSLIIELNNNPNSKGYIVNYGTAKQILAREKQIKQRILFLKTDISRINFIKSVTGTKIKTEFWLDTEN
jgi:hypothetical protein